MRRICFGRGGTQFDLARFEVELEAGAVWQSKNDVEIPHDGTATRFSLEDLVGGGPWPAGRFYFTWNINQRHGLRVLAAPLSYTETGTFETPVIFAGEGYAANVPTEATYQFNSWRPSPDAATYRAGTLRRRRDTGRRESRQHGLAVLARPR